MHWPADCLSGDQRRGNFDLIRYAVDSLTRDPAAAVYIDAGHYAVGQSRGRNRLNQAGSTTLADSV